MLKERFSFLFRFQNSLMVGITSGVISGVLVSVLDFKNQMLEAILIFLFFVIMLYNQCYTVLLLPKHLFKFYIGLFFIGFLFILFMVCLALIVFIVAIVFIRFGIQNYEFTAGLTLLDFGIFFVGIFPLVSIEWIMVKGINKLLKGSICEVSMNKVQEFFNPT